MGRRVINDMIGLGYTLKVITRCLNVAVSISMHPIKLDGQRPRHFHRR